MRLLSQSIHQKANNFAKITTWDSRKHISIALLIINVLVVVKEIFTARQMPTSWGSLQK